MEVVVKSQYDAEAYSVEEHSEVSVIISIASENMPNANISVHEANGIKDVLFMNFNDTDSKDLTSGCINDEDAENIKEFIEKYIENDSIDLIIVHCEAGVSRSAGVAAAIMKYLWNDDSAIFDNSKYHPNMLCYRTVLNTLMYDY